MKIHRHTFSKFSLWLATVCSLCASASAIHAATLVPYGSNWKYLVTPAEPAPQSGTTWKQPAYDDSAWTTGTAELGYGDGDEATVIGFGGNASNKYITTYFRISFNVPDPTIYAAASLSLQYDDGGVVYLNGAEVPRARIATMPTVWGTLADSPAIEDQTATVSISPLSLVAGTNVLAVEIHQQAVNSSDISFDLQLTATSTPTVIRGPYLQDQTTTSLVVRWRTDLTTTSQVRYGPSPGSLTTFVDDLLTTTEHIVTLTGLNPNQTYYYSVGTPNLVLAGDDATHFFTMPPPIGTRQPVRIWVLGDAGTSGTTPGSPNANQVAVRNAYYAFAGASTTHLWLMLGDNAYSIGTDAQHQAAIFDIYPTMLRKSCLWSTFGNHESYSGANSNTQTGAYYDIFTFPKAGEAGGLASGTEAYYSFDYANVHFLCLNSMDINRSPVAPMLTWAQADLAATNQDWVIAFWHHPPYTKGSHDSDFEFELVEMRQNALPILEAGGVDLVLTGHSHSYERSFLIDGFYGIGAIPPANVKNNGDGRPAGNGAYTKPTYGMGANEGTVYAVAGSSGQMSGGPLNHPAMFISLNQLGSMVLEVNANRLDAIFLNNSGAQSDTFTILKGITPTPTPNRSRNWEVYE